tara:strand:- start:558 stop:728 length:171 start_codon:yes stop_codon:yes gene_type:complete
MKNVFIVTYYNHDVNELEGIFTTFEDAENFANQLRGEIITHGNFNDSVGVKEHIVL